MKEKKRKKTKEETETKHRKAFDSLILREHHQLTANYSLAQNII